MHDIRTAKETILSLCGWDREIGWEGNEWSFESQSCRNSLQIWKTSYPFFSDPKNSSGLHLFLLSEKNATLKCGKIIWGFVEYCYSSFCRAGKKTNLPKYISPKSKFPKHFLLIFHFYSKTNIQPQIVKHIWIYELFIRKKYVVCCVGK